MLIASELRYVLEILERAYVFTVCKKTVPGMYDFVRTRWSGHVLNSEQLHSFLHNFLCVKSYVPRDPEGIQLIVYFAPGMYVHCSGVRAAVAVFLNYTYNIYIIAEIGMIRKFVCMI